MFSEVVEGSPVSVVVLNHSAGFGGFYYVSFPSIAMVTPFLRDVAQRVENVWNRRVHFLENEFLPMSFWVSERASKWMSVAECASAVHRQSKQEVPKEWISGASKQANRRASGSVLNASNVRGGVATSVISLWRSLVSTSSGHGNRIQRP